MTRSGDYISFYGTLITLALFFIATNRNLRWLGLGLYGFVLGLSRVYVSIFASEQALLTPRVYAFFMLLPLIIVFLAWLQNRYKTQQARFAE